MACPSCDAKRAVVESGHALDALLADVPYRQSREIDAILARTLTAYYRKKSNAPKGSAPAQFHAIQRFGSSVNLHVHVHAALSDGCFSFEKSTLKFHASRPPSVTDIADLLAVLRVRVFRRMLKLNAMPLSAVQEMMTWPHSGFALDCGPRYRSSG